MPNLSHWQQARTALLHDVGRPILLLANDVRDRTLPGSGLPFRQDSNLLWAVGDAGPGTAALLDAHGELTIFVHPHSADHALWSGPPESPEALAQRLGAAHVADIATLPAHIARTSPLSVAVADAAVNAKLSALLGRPFAFGSAPGDAPLIDALIAHRRRKDVHEIAHMRHAAHVTNLAHRAALAVTAPGIEERAVFGLFRAVFDAHDCVEGYDTILTQHGEILHHQTHDDTLQAGKLLLVDGGAEDKRSGYGIDVTRTWPVSGRFTPQQRAAYDAVHQAQAAAIALATPGTPYRDLHAAAALVLARFLVDEKLLIHISPEDAVETGAVAAFFPHGVGHLLGLDVHDLEAFGDRAAYPPHTARDPRPGWRYLRLNLPLEPGFVVTVEPGFYVVPSILHHAPFREAVGDVIGDATLAHWQDFGGIRIEDDILVTTGAPDVLTGALPSEAEAIESLMAAPLDLQAALKLTPRCLSESP